MFHHSNTNNFQLWPLPRPSTTTPKYIPDSYLWRSITNVTARSCTLPIRQSHSFNLAFGSQRSCRICCLFKRQFQRYPWQIKLNDFLSSLRPLYLERFNYRRQATSRLSTLCLLPVAEPRTVYYNHPASLFGSLAHFVQTRHVLHRQPSLVVATATTTGSDVPNSLQAASTL